MTFIALDNGAEYLADKKSHICDIYYRHRKHYYIVLD